MDPLIVEAWRGGKVRKRFVNFGWVNFSSGFSTFKGSFAVFFVGFDFGIVGHKKRAP